MQHQQNRITREGNSKITDEVRKVRIQSTMKDHKTPSTCIPVAKIEDDCYDWEKRHAKILDCVKKNQYDVVFIGDSITHFWEGSSGVDHGSAVWKKYYGTRKVLNLGYGFDRTQNVLWRVENGELAGQNPKIIIVNIGTNQFSVTPKHPLDTPEDAAEGIVAVARKLRKIFPYTHLVIMSVFPRSAAGQESFFRNLIVPTNAMVKKALGAMENLEIIDLTEKLSLPDGSLRKECFQPDLTHLDCPGYEIWASAVESAICKALGK